MSKRIFDYTNSCSCDDFNFRRRVATDSSLKGKILNYGKTEKT